jgi:hypothetical protein
MGVGGSGVRVGRMGVGGSGVRVGRTDSAVGGMGVAVGGMGVAVGSVLFICAVCCKLHATSSGSSSTTRYRESDIGMAFILDNA